MKKINGMNVKKLLIPVPEIAAQDDIVSQTESLRLVRMATIERQSELRAVKRALLDDMFATAAERVQ